MRALGLLLALAAGCGGGHYYASGFRGPDGEVWIELKCGRRLALCYEHAAQQCPEGYVIAKEDQMPSRPGELMVRCKYEVEP